MKKFFFIFFLFSFSVLTKAQRDLPLSEEVVDIGAIQSSKVQSGTVNKNAILIEISTGKKSLAPKAMIVHFYQRADQDGFYYLIDQDNGVYFKVSSRDLTPLTNDIAAFSEPSKFVQYDKKTLVDAKEAKPFSQYFRLASGVISKGFIQETFESTDLENGSALSFDWEHYYRGTLPFQVGAYVGYFKATLRDQNTSEKSRLKGSLPWGLAFQIPLGRGENFWIGAKGFYRNEYELSVKTPTENTNYQIYTSGFHANIQYRYQTENFWPVFFGIDWSRSYISSSDEELTEKINGRDIAIDVVAFNIALGFNYSWW